MEKPLTCWTSWCPFKCSPQMSGQTVSREDREPNAKKETPRKPFCPRAIGDFCGSNSLHEAPQEMVILKLFKIGVSRNIDSFLIDDNINLY